MTPANISALILVGSFALHAQSPAADGGEWLLPNLALRLSVQVSNPSSREVRGLVMLPVSKARAVAPDFPGTLALAVLLDTPAAATQGAVIPSQSDDLDGDDVPDQFEFPVVLGAHERRRIDIYYSMTLRDSITWPKHVHAKHSYGYNREVAAIESELIGYRTYGGFFLDVMAREAKRPGLYNDAAGWIPVRRDLGTGRDVLHIGDSLGLGGIFLRRNGKLYQPPMNVPTYAHKPSPEMVPHYRVIAQGPLRAIIETTLSDWNLDGDLITLKARYSMDEGQPLVRCQFETVPVRLAVGHEYEVGIGIRDLPNESSPAAAQGRLIVVGKQNGRDGTLGLALYYDRGQFSADAGVRTTESMNQAVIHNNRLAPGRAVHGEYVLAAAWKFGGVDAPGKYLVDLSDIVGVQIPAGDFRFSRTPKPERLDAEAQ
jgi:hypothetical protein